MRIDKEKLAKKLEDLSKELSLNEISKDVSNVIMFLSIYCGQNTVKVEEIELKNILCQKFSIDSYDNTQSLEIIISKSYIKIEKKSENGFNYYFVEYFFDKKGNFTRNAKQRSMPLDKELNIEEKSDGNLKSGIFYSEIEEKGDDINIISLKLPDKNKGENIYYCYSKNEDKIFYKLSEDFRKLPTIDVFGMAEVVNMLSIAGIKFQDEELFNNLIKTSKKYYKK